MKTIFYCNTMKEPGLTPVDKIIYSQILYLSLVGLEGFTNQGGHSPGDWIPFSELVNMKAILASTKTSESQYYLTIKRLQNNCCIKEESGQKSVKFVSLIPSFDLRVETGLSGYELILYSYISKMEERDGWCGLYREDIANSLGLSYKSLTDIINELYKKGKIIGTRKGRCVWLRTTKNTQTPPINAYDASLDDIGNELLKSY